jgi:predicted transcriptional regulator
MQKQNNLFGSNARVEILKLFFSRPEAELYIREICRQLGLHIHAVRRELLNLESVGVLVSKTENGDRKKYYRLDRKFKHLNSLSNLVIKW